jgi:perosamine synthetase
VNSCGTGLDIAMMCLDLLPGDEVISPAMTFRATHLCIIGSPRTNLFVRGEGAEVVMCEIDPKTFNIDPRDAERRMTSRTRAILAVHNNGLSAFMDELEAVAKRHPHPKHGPPKVIGDAARAVGATYKGTRVGKMGWMNVFSFQTTKNMTTLGEGGMITTDDPEVDRRARGYRAFGGGTELWGSNYRMTTLQAAVGRVQLRRLDEMNALRVTRARQLTALLAEVPELTTPSEPPECGHVYYGYTLLVPREWAGEKRNRLIKMLAEDYGVGAGVMNECTYKQSALIRKLGYSGADTPISEETGTRLFCPSLHPLMTDDDIHYIAAALAECVERMKKG